MRSTGTILLLQISVFIVAVSASPILVRWDEFALCLRKRLRRNVSPNGVCAIRKMALNFRRSLRCSSCELYFHCQANYEAIFHCSQAPEALQTAQVFSDCREFAQLGGPPAGVSARQEANLVGRRGGDCVGEYLTKKPDVSLATLLGWGSAGRCQWNPFEGTCAGDAGEVIASADYPPLPPTTRRPQTAFHRPAYPQHGTNVASSNAGQSNWAKPASGLMSLFNLTQPLIMGLMQKPPEKAPGLLQTLQALNALKDKLPSFQQTDDPNSIASHSPIGAVSQEPIHRPNGPVVFPHLPPPPSESSQSFLTQLTEAFSTSQNQQNHHSPPAVQTDTQHLPPPSPTAGSNSFYETNPPSGGGDVAPTEANDPWLSGIASAFGSFFGKPPVLPGQSGQSSDSRQNAGQRVQPVPIPLSASRDV